MAAEQDYREKYRDALSRLAAEEARWSKTQNVMKLLIGRLCLAGQGRDERLDQELSRVADSVRKQIDVDAIDVMLAPLSAAVAVLDGHDAASSSGRRTALPNSTTQSVPVTAATASATLSNATLKADSSAPPSVSQTTSTIKAASPAPLEPTTSVRNGVTGAAVPASDEGFGATAVLDRLALLPELQPVVGELRDRKREALNIHELADLLERVTRFATEQRATVQREKHELETLVQQMASRLEEITSHLTGDLEDRNAGEKDSAQLNLLVTDEVEQLRITAAGEADLPTLRRQLNTRLDSINTHLTDFRSREDTRVRTYRERVQHMRTRISVLERESRSLQDSLREEQRLAMIDALTGIPNRAAYDDRIEQEFKRWKRFARPVSILAWDIDRFKTINDAYGHKAGDKVLRVIGQHLARHVRDTDFVARYGGEEFVMLLVGTGVEEARVVADKVRQEVAQLGFHFHDHPVAVTASCGITSFTGSDTPDVIFDRADRALYKAKEAGRNCCVVG
ncbi:MAG: diguanylate cyclase [Gammaproteobacteria bacterium]